MTRKKTWTPEEILAGHEYNKKLIQDASARAAEDIENGWRILSDAQAKMLRVPEEGEALCRIAGCSDFIKAVGLCSAHYQQYRRFKIKLRDEFTMEDYEAFFKGMVRCVACLRSDRDGVDPKPYVSDSTQAMFCDECTRVQAMIDAHPVMMKGEFSAAQRFFAGRLTTGEFKPIDWNIGRAPQKSESNH